MMKVTETHLVPGIYISPGFYFDYWTKYLLTNFDETVLTKSNKYKPYREVLVGSVFAAAQTKLTGVHHFTGIPSRQPPDVEIVHIEENVLRKGISGNAFYTMEVEITRCDGDNGEQLMTHILNKNKPGNKNLVLLVEAYGKDTLRNLKGAHTSLQSEGIYPSDIYIISHLTKSGPLVRNPGSYLIASLYPEFSITEVNVNDSNAFFSYPEFIKKHKRNTSNETFDLGRYRLLPPD